MHLVPQFPRLPYIPPDAPKKTFSEGEVIAKGLRSLPASAPYIDLLEITLTKVCSLRNWEELCNTNSSISIAPLYDDEEDEIYSYFFSKFFLALYHSINLAIRDWKSLNGVQRFLLFTYVLSMPDCILADDPRLAVIVSKMGTDTYQYLGIINEIRCLQKHSHLFPKSNQASAARFLSFLQDQITLRFRGFCERDRFGKPAEAEKRRADRISKAASSQIQRVTEPPPQSIIRPSTYLDGVGPNSKSEVLSGVVAAALSQPVSRREKAEDPPIQGPPTEVTQLPMPNVVELGVNSSCRIDKGILGASRAANQTNNGDDNFFSITPPSENCDTQRDDQTLEGEHVFSYPLDDFARNNTEEASPSFNRAVILENQDSAYYQLHPPADIYPAPERGWVGRFCSCVYSFFENLM